MPAYYETGHAKNQMTFKILLLFAQVTAQPTIQRKTH